MPSVDEAIKRLEQAEPERVAIAIWSEADVLGRAEELEIVITKEQARDIIDRVDHKQDCSLGITWDTIDCYLDELR